MPKTKPKKTWTPVKVQSAETVISDWAQRLKANACPPCQKGEHGSCLGTNWGVLGTNCSCYKGGHGVVVGLF